MAKKSILEKFIPVLIVLSIGLAFGVGVLWQKVQGLEKEKTATPQASIEPSTTPAVSLNQIKGLFSKNLIKFGDANRKLLFVEVSDPSCPFCQIAGGLNPALNIQVDPRFKLVKDGGSYVAPVPEMRKLVDAEKASFVWLYYPGHGNGEMGAKALYCAFESNKFWQVNDLLMSSAGYSLLNNTIQNDKTQSQTLANFLKSAVDPTTMKTCLNSGKYDARLASDTQLAEPLFPPNGGTPNFYVNATNFDGAVSFTDMQSAVDAALK